MLLGIARAGYRANYLHGLYRNQHRQAWLHERGAYAQQPLHMLGFTYYFPLEGHTLAQIITEEKPLIKVQMPRVGSERVAHTLFPDGEPLLEEPLPESLIDENASSLADGEVYGMNVAFLPILKASVHSMRKK